MVVFQRAIAGIRGVEITYCGAVRGVLELFRSGRGVWKMVDLPGEVGQRSSHVGWNTQNFLNRGDGGEID